MSTARQFRKKPVVVEAMLFDGTNAQDIFNWSQGEITVRHRFGIAIETLEGSMLASPGDWIIRGVQGEFYPCKPGIFEVTYELSCDECDDTHCIVAGGMEGPCPKCNADGHLRCTRYRAARKAKKMTQDEVELGYERGIQFAIGKGDSDLAHWLQTGLREYQRYYKVDGSNKPKDAAAPQRMPPHFASETNFGRPGGKTR